MIKIEKELTKDISLDLIDTKQKNEQTNFLESTLGKIINKGIDFGIKIFLPDFIDDAVIDIKNVFLKNGINKGVKEVASKAIEIGKSALGIVTKKFDNISQIENVVKKGGILEGTSDLIDDVVKKAKESKYINKTTASFIKGSKNEILGDINKNIKEELQNQKKLLNQIEKYSENWKEYYNNNDIENMNKEYNKIKNIINNTVPLEEITSKVNEIENIQKLLANRNNNILELNEYDIELAKKLA